MNTHQQHLLPIGTILKGTYKTLSVLGQGGFGITYKAEHIFLKEMRVVKEFFLESKCIRDNDKLGVQTQSLPQAEFDKFKARFLEEAQILSKLKKVPNTIEVVDFFEENNTGYLVMPFVEGEDMLKHLQKQPNSRISEKEALAYFAQIATALSQIHAVKIIHRDLKPANILVEKTGKAYLIDFGAAREYIAEGLTQTMTAILTPGYAPIEQYDEQAKRGATTDIYAMGAVLYRMLTGKNPTNAISRLSAQMPTPQSLVPTLSVPVSEAIMKAMEMQAKDRFQSVAEMQAALQGTIIPETPLPKPEESDWILATKQDTIGAYETFLFKYPHSTYKGIADKRIAALKPKKQEPETEAWGKKTPIATPSPLLVFWEKYKIHALSGFVMLFAILFLPKIIGDKYSADEDKKGVAAYFEPQMVQIPTGSFMMGSNDYSSEQPIHKVNIKGFAMGKYEVTQQQWQAIMGTSTTLSNPSNFKGGNLPVEQVSWEDIEVFLQKLNDKTGKKYRLPTEAEWEYAARGGQDFKYAGSNDLKEVAWLDENSDSKTHPVGQKKANGYGFMI